MNFWQFDIPAASAEYTVLIARRIDTHQITLHVPARWPRKGDSEDGQFLYFSISTRKLETLRKAILLNRAFVPEAINPLFSSLGVWSTSEPDPPPDRLLGRVRLQTLG